MNALNKIKWTKNYKTEEKIGNKREKILLKIEKIVKEVKLLIKVMEAKAKAKAR